MSTLVTHNVHTLTQAIVHTQTHNNIWLRKRTISTLDWERGQSRHSIEKEDNLDTQLRNRTISTLNWERGQSEHLIEKEDNLNTQLRKRTISTQQGCILFSQLGVISHHVVPLLSPRHSAHVIIPTSLSPRHCLHVIVSTSLSPRHCPHVIVPTSLSPRHCPHITVPTLSPCHCHQVKQGQTGQKQGQMGLKQDQTGSNRV